MMHEIDISDLRKDDIFYECEYGSSEEYVALEDAHEKVDDIHNGISCNSRNTKTGEEIEFFQAFECAQFRLKLYKKEKQMEYKIGDTVKYTIDVENFSIHDSYHDPVLEGVIISVQGDRAISITRYGTLVLHVGDKQKTIHQLHIG